MKTNLTFLILGDTLVPNDISAALGVSPTTSYAKGAPYDIPRVGLRRRSTGHWSICTESVVDSDRLEEHARYLLAKLEPRAATIQGLLNERRYRVNMAVWWEIDAEHGNFIVPSAVMARLAILCENIDFHFIASVSVET